MSKAWRKGSDTAWRKLRLVILTRDEYKCKIATPGEWKNRFGVVQRCLGTATQVHHTLGRQITGDDPDYLVAACAPCNQKVGDPTAIPDPPCRPVTRW